MSYREDDAEARTAAAIAELEARLAKLEQDRAALHDAARAQRFAGLSLLKRPFMIFALILALVAGVGVGHELGRKRKLVLDLCPPGTAVPEGLAK